MNNDNPFHAPDFTKHSHTSEESPQLSWKDKTRIVIFGVIVTFVFFIAIFIIIMSIVRALSKDLELIRTATAGYGFLLSFIMSLGLAARIGWIAALNEYGRLKDLNSPDDHAG